MLITIQLLVVPAVVYSHEGQDPQKVEGLNLIYPTAYGPSDTKYAVISNESTDGYATQSTGTFSMKGENFSQNPKIKQGKYKVDVNKPFDKAASKGKLVEKSSNFIKPSYSVGDRKQFWVTDFTSSTDYQINARLAYSGPKANVWVNDNDLTFVSDVQAKVLGSEFEQKVYPAVTNNFGSESNVDGDGKINILCFDIQDGFSGSGGYIAGYFYGGDLFEGTTSNKSEIFYIDTNPTMGMNYTLDVSMAFETLAHEFQHMVEFNQNVLIEGKNQSDTWLSEGLSMASEQIYLGQGLDDRIDYYNISTTIPNGHSLLFWGDFGDILSNYSLSYLFIQYLKLQTNQGNAIFKEILQDPNNNYKAVENVAKRYIHHDMTFGKLMTNFRIALLLKEPSGLYGFKGEPFFNALQNKTFTGSSVNLRGGGSVVKIYKAEEGFSIPASKGADITITTLAEGREVDDIPPAPPKVATVTDHDSTVKGSTEGNAQIKIMVGTTLIGSGWADSSGQFSVTIPKQKGGTTIMVIARDLVGNESTTQVKIKTSYTSIKVQLNGQDFSPGYFGNSTTYVNWIALKIFKIPYTYKGSGVFVIEGHAIQGVAINGNWYIQWKQLSPGKITYKKIEGGYNFIYMTPIKVQLNSKDFPLGGYFRNNTTYVNWNALNTLKIPYTYKGNGVFLIDGYTVQGVAINGDWCIQWKQLSPGKITYKEIEDGYNFIYTSVIKIQLNSKEFTQGGYFRNNTTYVNWNALKTFRIPYSYKGSGLFLIEGRNVLGEAINGNWYIQWKQLSPGRITYKNIDGGYNFIYNTPIKIKLNGIDFIQGGYFRMNTTYVNWNALKTLNIPYSYKGNGVFLIEGRTVLGEAINGDWYIRWIYLSPGKVTYKIIEGGYNFIYQP
jgi:hypothetical protein